MDVLSRRQFVLVGGVAGLGLLAGCGRWPWQAARPVRVPRIGYLEPASERTWFDAFRAALGELGYVEGQSLSIEYRSAEGQPERLPGLATELAVSNVELVVARGSAAALAAADAAPATPIVLGSGGGDAVGTGLIASFARPGGNITGVNTASVDIAAKWLELLKEAVPTLSRVAVLSDPTPPVTSAHLTEIERAAATLGVRLQALSLGAPEELTGAFSAMQQEHAEGLVLLPGGRAGPQRSRIAALALTNGLPSVSEWREFAAGGGLLAYGTNVTDLLRRAAVFVDKILKGAKPADLPVERPMRFDFVINLKTAQALGLTIPHEILLQVTEVIQ
jgi:putative tryptophan/tyrosine transport system substrate-binding protein